ncbi:hypothetical protein C1H46_022559 [Malus baccata]|uniref:Uncharacterized protein n=1 Tax=Malus baccata TaxID=106549 RepID=A0A540LZX2_MALBA|nr:hypothetical protein C1H46_022559 [Malus baccata]
MVADEVVCGLAGGYRPELHAQADQGFDLVGPEQAEEPSDDGAPVVGHHEHLLLIGCDGVQERHEVSNHVEAVGEGGGGVSVATPSEVGGDDAVAEGGEGEDLVAPALPEIGNAVDEEDEWAIPFLGSIALSLSNFLSVWVFLCLFIQGSLQKYLCFFYLVLLYLTLGLDVLRGGI